MKIHFRPKLFDALHDYNQANFVHDLSAGITVGVLALPLAMAFAIASGLTPTAGIWTAIVAGFIISLFGGSKVQIGGPTGAFIPIVYGIVAGFGIQNLLIATMMSGIMLFAMGAFRLGSMIRFIPLSVVIGFTNGIAIVIFLSQIKDFFGLQIENLPGEFFAKMSTLFYSFPTLHWPTVIVAILSLLGLLVWTHKAARIAWMRRIPAPLAVLVIVTTLNALFNLPIDTIGSRFNGIPSQIPDIALPALDLGSLGKLFTPALTITLLGAIESLLSARVADSMIDDRHNPNQELMAQGLANFIAPLFGGFAATGAIARTATNVRSGGRTPIAGIIHAFVLLAIVLALAPLASHIPLATLSAIVVIVSINMGDWKAFSLRELARYSLQYRIILLGTFFVTVIFDLTVAVELGMVLASLFFIYRMSDLTRIERIELEGAGNTERYQKPDGTPHILAYKLSGSLFFGAVNKLENLLQMKDGHADVLILDMNKVINIDTTGLDILQAIQRNLKKRGATLILCDLNSQPESIIKRSGFIDRIGIDNIVSNISIGLLRAHEIIAELADEVKEDT